MALNYISLSHFNGHICFFKTKKKKHKQKSDSEEEEKNTEEMITEKKGKTKSKPMAMYDMLMMDDDSENDIPSDVRVIL